MSGRLSLGVVCCTAAMTTLGASVAVSEEIIDLPASYAQAVRYLVAASILVPLAMRKSSQPGAERVTTVGWSGLLRLAVLAVTGLAGFNAVVLAALRRADPAVVGSIIGCTPLVLAAVGPIQRRERPSGSLLAAAAVVMAGAGIVQGTGHATAVGVLFALAALAGEASFSLLAAPLLPRIGAVRVSAATCLLAVPMLLVAGGIAGEQVRMPTVSEAAALAYLAVLLTAGAFVVWYTGLATLGVERAGLFAGLVPVASLIAAAVLGAEAPGLGQVAGVLLVGGGIALGLAGSRRSVDVPSRDVVAADDQLKDLTLALGEG